MSANIEGRAARQTGEGACILVLVPWTIRCVPLSLANRDGRRIYSGHVDIGTGGDAGGVGPLYEVWRSADLAQIGSSAS